VLLRSANDSRGVESSRRNRNNQPGGRGGAIAVGITLLLARAEVFFSSLHYHLHPYVINPTDKAEGASMTGGSVAATATAIVVCFPPPTKTPSLARHPSSESRNAARAAEDSAPSGEDSDSPKMRIQPYQFGIFKLRSHLERQFHNQNCLASFAM
jgi:hypothetical protein